ncbi:hypothetical protein IQ241_21715 [Romeria aff. gracilis LEGE 07310]|uniref:Uncharacterized protein n=1 Tax=Vasconcelosia minhoensis LEGE 07310 TaxID=915328 RepID=A0A8J7AY77_9CYAN|nr:hypothetical protein [Romeria gracilis]MBE9079878.1 hypothetical protein [Romeria aff. gracilis LEGE 07310]
MFLTKYFSIIILGFSITQLGLTFPQAAMAEMLSGEDRIEAIENFNLAAQKHRWSLYNLVATRGLANYDELLFEIPTGRRFQNISVDDVADVLATGEPTEIFPYPEETALLFYSYEANSFQIWLITHGSLIYFSGSPDSENATYGVTRFAEIIGKKQIAIM